MDIRKSARVQKQSYMIPLTDTDGSRVYIDVREVESVSDGAFNGSVVMTKSGKQHLVRCYVEKVIELITDIFEEAIEEEVIIANLIANQSATFETRHDQ